MTKQVPLTWEEYCSKFPKPGILIMTPEQEAAINNSPYFKEKNERAIRILKEHPLPWGEIIWKD
ncbi:MULTISPECIES: hypothetical protein [unclassified Chitinophaga]|uniref:hypothetical protein n=1 Tax=unclassified Chitinophaga TaxID=2619133 RepID=UPI0009CD8833|nr:MULTISPECIES: hypothetical protein [unclassified Chitinophaga]OMP78906.1 hypothetical protein BW716_12310 [[Flexibacter] sp. ATCC 35208]WPV64410.1 hypothetical protein QQL36_21650 [Chitinophaga sp. LS1]